MYNETEIFGDIWRPKGYELVVDNNPTDLFTKFTYKPKTKKINKRRKSHKKK